MSKKLISNKETKVSTQGGIGQQYVHTVTVDDNMFPSPAEMAEYKKVDPQLVEHIIDTARLEQAHRHKMDDFRIGVVKRTVRRSSKMNWWGMFFAFLALLSLVGLSAFALYLDRPWFAGILTFATVISIVSLFVNAGTKK